MTRQLVDVKSQSSADIKTGRRIRLELETPAVSGYKWDAEYNNENLMLVSYETKVDTGSMGASAKQYISFKVLKPGKHHVHFCLHRPWESEKIKEYDFVVTGL